MTDNSTPLLKQYLEIKKQYPDRLLFFRMGDFYEMFGDDAKTAADILGITLTSRNHGKAGKIPLAGVPYHQAEKYLAKLLKAGFGVAVCEQVEDPKLAKGLVKRDVVEIITPGSITVEGALDDGAGSYIAAINIADDKAGIAFADYTTGEFMLDEIPLTKLELTIGRFQPSELLLPDNYSGQTWHIPTYYTQQFKFDYDMALSLLNDHFGTATLDGFGCSDMPLAIGAAGAILDYLKKLKIGQVDHLRKLKRAISAKEMFLDQATITNLELLTDSSGQKEFSLLGVLDRCRTAMGKRLLRNRLIAPLTDKNEILFRQQKVSAFYNDRNLSDDVGRILGGIRDLERILSRFVAGRANPRDLLALKESFASIIELKKRIQPYQAFAPLIVDLDEFPDLLPRLESALVDNPPVSYLEGGIFKRGYSVKLDTLKEEIREAQTFIKTLQDKERRRTGISNLKVGYNKVFGYYIEISRGQIDKVPPEYIRKQTLVNAERYITQEMKEKEELILKAEEKINLLEAELFLELKGIVKEASSRVLATSRAVAEIDFFRSLAQAAIANYYTLPTITDDQDDPDGVIDIKAGRHPMVEKSLPPGEFIPNDTLMNTGDKMIQIITGPNMAGKSTYLRQVGLIVLMAQMGGFVPADSAKIALTDRVFTRVGAADKLSRGQSTFMVEMTETANILNNATPKSLILLDELGRGTSTYDGLSLAWAVTEYLWENKAVSCRTLFATHYHELTEMANICDGIINLQVAVKESGDKIIFLRKIIPGGCDDSYGIEVARLAGLPKAVVNKANKILQQLESKQPPETVRRKIRQPVTDSFQISLFSPKEAKLAARLKAVNLDQLTPLEAFELIRELKSEL
jgi:DNA mismatch repair protein MutS